MLSGRDMLCGASRFSDLSRCNPRLSRTLLARRLRQLERAGIVDHVGDDYTLTPAGAELHDIVFGLGEWGAKWMFDAPRLDELDPQLLMWWVHDRLDFSCVPGPRLVLEFRFAGIRPRFWVLHDSQGASVCTTDPGFGVDVVVTSDLSTLYQVWLGRIALARARRAGTVTATGDTATVRLLPDMFRLSPIAPAVNAAAR